jgi:hypothetical protein
MIAHTINISGGAVHNHVQGTQSGQSTLRECLLRPPPPPIVCRATPNHNVCHTGDGVADAAGQVVTEAEARKGLCRSCAALLKELNELHHILMSAISDRAVQTKVSLLAL